LTFGSGEKESIETHLARGARKRASWLPSPVLLGVFLAVFIAANSLESYISLSQQIGVRRTHMELSAQVAAILSAMSRGDFDADSCPSPLLHPPVTS
jgi:hypothetical protein